MNEATLNGKELDFFASKNNQKSFTFAKRLDCDGKLPFHIGKCFLTSGYVILRGKSALSAYF